MVAIQYRISSAAKSQARQVIAFTLSCGCHSKGTVHAVPFFMPEMPASFRPAHIGTKAEANRRHDRDRGSSIERGYTAQWRRASAEYRRANPLCAYCLLNDGRTTLATCTDHLYPQRVYDQVFWSRHWWVSSCDACHSGFKQAVERQGKSALDALAVRLGREVLA